MPESDDTPNKFFSDDEFADHPPKHAQTTRLHDGLNFGAIAESAMHDFLRDTEHSSEGPTTTNKGQLLRWLLRWPRWLYLVARELPDMAEHAAMTQAILCALATTALVFPAFVCIVAPSQFVMLVAITTGITVYLGIGLVSFFTAPNTNAPVHWTRNGSW